MPKRFIDPAWFCLGCLAFVFSLIWQLSVPAFSQTQPKVLPGPAPKGVLLLYAYGDGLPAYQKATPSFLSVVTAGGINTNDLFFEYLDLQRNDSAEYRQRLASLLRYKYARHPVRLIITVHTDALNFLLDEGRGLFPDAPVFSYLVVRPELIEAKKTDRRIIQRPQGLDMGGTLETALKMFPKTKKIVFVTGTASGDRRIEHEARTIFKPWRDRLEFQYTGDLSYEEILQLVSNLPPRSIVIYGNVFSDKTGRAFIPLEVGKKVAKAANVPVFCLWDTLMGQGPIGGSLLSFEAEGAYAAKVALDILNGKAPLTKPVTTLPTSKVFMFDSQQLRRWGVKESILPEGSMLVNRVPTLWEQHKILIVGGIVVLLAQTLLVIGLLVERRRKKVAEETLRKQLEFERLISDISARFLNVAPHDVDQEIEGALKRIVDFFRVSHCVLIKGFPGEHKALISHAASAEGVPPTPLGGDLYSFFPWTSEMLAQGKIISIPTLDQLPAEAAADKEAYRNLGVRSFLVIPILIVNLPKYAISMSIHQEATVWPRDYIPRLQLLGEILVSMLERKGAEESLRQKTEELDQFFNVTLDILCIANTKGYFLRLNPAAERILGYTREELVAKPFLELVHSEDLERTKEAISALKFQQKVYSFENRYRCKDGTYRWLQWNAVPAAGLIYSSARDVTEQKRAEEALRQSQEEAQRVAREALVRAEVGRVIGSTLTIEEVYESFATVVKSVIPFDRIVITTIDGEKGVFEVAYAAGAKFEDRKAGKVYALEGTGIAEMLRTQASFLLQTGNLADYQGRFPGLLLTFQAGFQSILDIPLVTRGTVIGALLLRSFKPEAYTEEHVQLAVRIGNQIAGAIANAQLFSKQKRTEGALRESEERFRQVAESVGDFIWEIDANGLYLYTSPSVEKILGYTPDELIGKKHFYDLFAPEVREWLKEAAFEVFAAKGSFRALPNPNISKEGKVVDLETSGVPILDAGGNLMGYRGADIDVTERKLAEQAIEERLRFERLLSDLSARFVNISHDRVDSEIERGLRKILDFFQVDRCGLVRTLPGRMTWQITHVATAEGVPMIPQRIGLPVSIRPWAFEKLILKHEVVSFSKVDDLPAEADVDRQGHIEWGVKSTLNIPIMTGEPVDYILAVNSVKTERVWPEELIQRLRLLGEILVNALERKQIRLQIEERLRFESLISNLSAGFVNLSPDEVDGEINKGLRSITEFFDADRCTIGLFTEDGTQLSSVFEYRSAVAEPAVESLSKEQMPWYVEQLMCGKPVVINRVEDLPPEAEKERQLCLARGMKSLLSMPMVSGGVPLGACALVSTRAERVWPEELVKRFQLVSEVFANALKGKRADTLLQTSEEKFRQFFAHTPEFCYIVSTEGVILDVNDWALQGLGYAREDLIGKPLATVYAPESIPKMRDLFARWKEKGEIRNEEMVVVTKKGEKRTILLNAGAVRDKAGAIIHSASIQTDITERKQAEAEVNRAREQLLHVERSARIGELTASLAHELNQPLAAILSNAQAALRFLQSDKVNLDELREILHDITQDDQRAGNVIRSLRSMMKREERERSLVILNTVLSDVTQIFHAESIFRNVHIDTAFDESLPPVLGDKVQLQQVVLNLIVNAADAMSQNPPEDRKIFMGTQAKNGRIRVAIRDFGPGIDEGSLERIFQPFFTTKKKGLGMGLAVCQTIVEAHDGHIWAENNPNGGATFFIELPVISNQ